MDQFTRKSVSQPKIPDPAPVQKPGDPEEDCGCGDKQGSQPGSGGCPDQPYVAGGFSLVVKNKTSGACQVADLDFIQDNQPDWYLPPAISYTPNPAEFPVLELIEDLVPENTGGPATSYEISGALPDGLSFDTSTGIISGTPTGTPSDDTYTITAHGPGGDSETELEIIIEQQQLTITNLGSQEFSDQDGDINQGESRTYNYVTNFPYSVSFDDRGYWYWFEAINPGDEFFYQGELVNQILQTAGVIPVNGQWYYDRTQGDMGGFSQSQLAFNKANNGVNHIGINSAVVLVGAVGSHLGSITEFKIMRSSDDHIMYDGLADLTSNNPYLGVPFIPPGSSEFYYIKITAGSNFNVTVKGAFITGQGSASALSKTFSIASGNWSGPDSGNNRFGAPLQIIFS